MNVSHDNNKINKIQTNNIKYKRLEVPKELFKSNPSSIKSLIIFFQYHTEQIQ